MEGGKGRTSGTDTGEYTHGNCGSSVVVVEGNLSLTHTWIQHLCLERDGGFLFPLDLCLLR